MRRMFRQLESSEFQQKTWVIICLLTYVKIIIIQNDKDRNIPSIDKVISVLMKNSYVFNDKLSFKFEEAFTLMINKLT